MIIRHEDKIEHMEAGIKANSSHRLSIKPVSLTLAISFSIAYVGCVLYGILSPTPLHTGILETIPFFKWLDPASFLIGLTLVFVGGLFYGTVGVLIYNYLIRRT
jgi:hypothetical protein